MLGIMIMYSGNRRLPLRSNKVFQCNLYVTFACLVENVACVLAIFYSDRLPWRLVELLSRTHMAFMVLVSLLAVVYVFTSTLYHLPFYKKTMRAAGILGTIAIILTFVLSADIIYDSVRNVTYTSGLSALVTFISVFTAAIYNLIMIRRYRKHIFERQRRTLIVWMCIWLSAWLAQMLISGLMVVDFATALGILIVFIQFENPVLYLDRTTGLFSAIAYNRYVEELFSRGGGFSVVGITFENTPWQDDMKLSHSMEESQRLYNAFLMIPGAYVFKIQDNEIMVVFPKQEEAEYAWGVVTSQRHQPNIDVLPSRPSVYYIPDPRCVNSPIEVLELLRYVSMGTTDSQAEIFHIIDSAMVEQIIAERATAQMIRDALDEDRVVVYYQPIYSVTEQRFTSAEALVRIIDRDGKLVPPGAFIKVAEQNGLIKELGKRVFEKTCQFYQSNDLDTRGLGYIEVNLSVAQCADAGLSDDYIGIMENANIEPRRINLEITESTSAREKKTLIAHMDRMIGHGVNFSLDDFGSGASNLNYIMDMPVKIVKFDKEMIQAYFSSDKARYVMEAAMHMIHGLGLEIVAEGVETEEQYRKLEEIKINYIQGFYFSKPLPEQEFLTFLHQMNVETPA